jgi:hypothetical protein
MLIAIGYWGWHLSGVWRYISVVGLPATAAALWGIFRIPNDPKPAPIAIPGILRLLLELGLFGFASWALHDLGLSTLSIIMAVIVTIHYMVSYDRTLAMLKGKPYEGFVKQKSSH